MKKILKVTQIDGIKDQKTTLVGGCFDILHFGHLEFLKKSKNLGNSLVVLLENDENIKNLKGKNRPLNNQIVRAENLSKIEEVDYIIMLNTPNHPDYYTDIVKSLKPAIIAITKGDPLTQIKKGQAELVGGKVVEVIKRNPKHSTSKILEKNFK
jgi:rfaE bifunctional protein nucleotidyltransferase chain/domain